jgi:hypothetical protein
VIVLLLCSVCPVHVLCASIHSCLFPLLDKLATNPILCCAGGICAAYQPRPPLCLPDGTCISLPPPGLTRGSPAPAAVQCSSVCLAPAISCQAAGSCSCHLQRHRAPKQQHSMQWHNTQLSMSLHPCSNYSGMARFLLLAGSQHSALTLESASWDLFEHALWCVVTRLLLYLPPAAAAAAAPRPVCLPGQRAPLLLCVWVPELPALWRDILQ